MRKLVALLGLCLLTTVPEFAAAQTPDSPIESVRNNRYRNIRRPMTLQDQLVYQRAHQRAIQREARLDARKWTGYSPLRPTIVDGHHSQDLNGYIWAPRDGYYVLHPGW